VIAAVSIPHSSATRAKKARESAEVTGPTRPNKCLAETGVVLDLILYVMKMEDSQTI
jgi:hypothetical protein